MKLQSVISFSIAFFCSRYADAKAYRLEIAANETEAVTLFNGGNAFSRNVAVDILIPSDRSEVVVTIRLKKIAAGLTHGGIVRICGLITRPVSFRGQSVCVRM